MSRPNRQARGYDAAYDQARAQWQRRLDQGERVQCWRCALAGRVTVINPREWDLGHDDHDRTIIRGPECWPCNRATATRRAEARRRTPQPHPGRRRPTQGGTTPLPPGTPKGPRE